MNSVTFDQISPIVLGLIEENIDVKINITGVSMLPMLVPKRDSVVLTNVKGKVKKGDVVLFRREDGDFVLHRVCKMEENSIACVGDSQRAIEKDIQMQNVFGVLKSFERAGKIIDANSFGYKVYVFFGAN